jgi:hypothetical protein
MNRRGAPELAAALADALHDRAGITRSDVLDSFRIVPRHVFVPGAPLADVYTYDAVIPTRFDGSGVPTSSSSAPNIMAALLGVGSTDCADRLNARLPGLEPLRVEDLDIRAVQHPAPPAPDAWLLERPTFDLVVRERRRDERP